MDFSLFCGIIIRTHFPQYRTVNLKQKIYIIQLNNVTKPFFNYTWNL